MFYFSTMADIKLEGSECLLVCCVSLIIGVDIAALIVGLQESYECVNEGEVMDMQYFAIAIGIVGIGCAVVSILSAMCICPKNNDENGYNNMKKQSGLLMSTSLTFLGVSIVGFINWSSCSGDCKTSPLGQVILAWCIIRIISAFCGCLQGASACNQI